MKVLALIAAFLLGWFAQDSVHAIRKTFARWRAQPTRRRFPDPFEHEYRRGWLWGVVCGACAAALVTGIIAAAMEGKLA